MRWRNLKLVIGVSAAALALSASGCLRFGFPGAGDDAAVSETGADLLGGDALGRCGNGVLDDGEVCDDGNLEQRDNCSADCQRRGCTVPGDYATLKEALGDPECDDVWVAGGIYAGPFTVNRAVRISGEGQAVTTLTGEAVNRVLGVDAPGALVSIDNLTITDGFNETDGAGLRMSSDVAVTAVTFRNNLVSGSIAQGAGIFVVGASLTVRTTSFDNNALQFSGSTSVLHSGAAIQGLGATITLEQVGFSNNSIAITTAAEALVGPVDVGLDTGSLSINGMTSRNASMTVSAGDKAQSVGGSVACADCDFLLQMSDIRDLSLSVTGVAESTIRGGGIYLDLGTGGHSAAIIDSSVEAMIDGGNVFGGVLGYRSLFTNTVTIRRSTLRADVTLSDPNLNALAGGVIEIEQAGAGEATMFSMEQTAAELTLSSLAPTAIAGGVTHITGTGDIVATIDRSAMRAGDISATSVIGAALLVSYQSTGSSEVSATNCVFGDSQIASSAEASVVAIAETFGADPTFDRLLLLSFATVAGNAPAMPPLFASGSASQLVLKNSILSNAPSAGVPEGCTIANGAQISSEGGNHSSLSCAGLNHPTDVILPGVSFVEDGLTFFGDIFGYRLAAASTALDNAIDCADISGAVVSVDLVGTLRPQNGSCDPGALETAP